MKIGERARFVQPVIEGAIAGKRYSQEHDTLEYLIVYQDKFGETQYRWFLEQELKALEGA